MEHIRLFESFNEAALQFDVIEQLFVDNVGKECVFKLEEFDGKMEEKGILKKSDSANRYAVEDIWYDMDWMRDQFTRGVMKNLTIKDNNLKYTIDGWPSDLTFDVK